MSVIGAAVDHGALGLVGWSCPRAAESAAASLGGARARPARRASRSRAYAAFSRSNFRRVGHRAERVQRPPRRPVVELRARERRPSAGRRAREVDVRARLGRRARARGGAGPTRRLRLGHAVGVALRIKRCAARSSGTLGVVAGASAKNRCVLAGFNIVSIASPRPRPRHGQLLLARVVVPAAARRGADGLPRQNGTPTHASPCARLSCCGGSRRRTREARSASMSLLVAVVGSSNLSTANASPSPVARSASQPQSSEERELHRRVRPGAANSQRVMASGRAAGRGRPRSPGAGACRRRSP